MKKLFLIAVSALLFTTSAHAKDKPRDAVRTKDGVVVRNTFNNCVNTQWDGTGKCKGGMNLAERTVYFDFGQDSLTKGAQLKLSALAKKLRGSRNVSSLRVVGYADEIGDSGPNQNLSERRAQAVESYLASKVNLRFADSVVRGLGEANSRTSCSKSEPRDERIRCLGEDRRVEVEINYAR